MSFPIRKIGMLKMPKIAMLSTPVANKVSWYIMKPIRPTRILPPTAQFVAY